MKTTQFKNYSAPSIGVNCFGEFTISVLDMGHCTYQLQSYIFKSGIKSLFYGCWFLQANQHVLKYKQSGKPQQCNYVQIKAKSFVQNCNLLYIICSIYCFCLLCTVCLMMINVV